MRMKLNLQLNIFQNRGLLSPTQYKCLCLGNIYVYISIISFFQFLAQNSTYFHIQEISRTFTIISSNINNSVLYFKSRGFQRVDVDVDTLIKCNNYINKDFSTFSSAIFDLLKIHKSMQIENIKITLNVRIP